MISPLYRIIFFGSFVLCKMRRIEDFLLQRFACTLLVLHYAGLSWRDTVTDIRERRVTVIRSPVYSAGGSSFKGIN